MAWFNIYGPTKPKKRDAEVLRRGLVHLLTDLEKEVPRSEAHRIQELVERLQRYPMPSGLDKEVERLVSVLRTSALGSGSSDFADAVSALVDAMQRVSIMDKDLTAQIAELKDSIPLRVRPGDSRSIQASATAVEHSADRARYRLRESQEMVIALLDAVGTHIKEAKLHSDLLVGQLGQVTRRLGAAQDPDEMVTLRADLDALMGQLGETSEDLKSEVFRAHSRFTDLDQTVRKQREEVREARIEITNDTLTNVANRISFDQAMVGALVHARRSSGLLSLMILDLDHFKKVNESFGRSSGDDVLRTVSQVLLDTVRQDDFVARIGGEEFAAILPNSGKREASGVADRIGQSIRNLQFTHKETTFSITISIGIASWDRNEPASSLYRRADRAMKKAKKAGRDRYVVV